MKIAGFKRLVKESVPQEQRALIDVLGPSINTFAENVINALNKNITVGDNLAMEYKSLEVTVNASGVPINVTQFKTGLSSKVVGMSVESADNLTNSTTYPTTAPFISFDLNDKIVTIQHVTGLQANNKYQLTLLVKS